MQRMVGVQQLHGTAGNRNSQYNTYDNRDDPGLEVRNRRGSTGSYSKRRYDQLVRSIDRRNSTWNWHKLYNAEYKYDDNILRRLTDGGCTTATRTAVIATINTIPTITGTTPGSRCGTGVVVLSATASAGTINWYAASTGGVLTGNWHKLYNAEYKYDDNILRRCNGWWVYDSDKDSSNSDG